MACDALRWQRTKLLNELHSMLTGVFFLMMLAGAVLITCLPSNLYLGLVMLVKLLFLLIFAGAWLMLGNRMLSRLVLGILSKQYCAARRILDTGGLLQIILGLCSEDLQDNTARLGPHMLIPQNSLNSIAGRLQYAAACLSVLPARARGAAAGSWEQSIAFMLAFSARRFGILLLAQSGVSVIMIGLSAAYLLKPTYGYQRDVTSAVVLLALGLLTLLLGIAYIWARLAYTANYLAITEHLLWQRDFKDFGTAPPPAELIRPLQVI